MVFFWCFCFVPSLLSTDSFYQVSSTLSTLFTQGCIIWDILGVVALSNTLDKMDKLQHNDRMPKLRRNAQRSEDKPTDEEMADKLSGDRRAALAALRDLRIAMRHVAGHEPLHKAYSIETGSTGTNASKWSQKATARYWLEAVQLAKEATDESIAAAIEGSQLMTLADPNASHRDKTAAAALLAKVRGLDRLKIEVAKSEEDLIFEDLLKRCQVKTFKASDAIEA